MDYRELSEKERLTPRSISPVPISVVESDQHLPLQVVPSKEEGSLAVVLIDDRWVVGEYWRPYPESENPHEMWFNVTLADGQQLTIFRRMLHQGFWYRLHGLATGPA